MMSCRIGLNKSDGRRFMVLYFRFLVEESGEELIFKRIRKEMGIYVYFEELVEVYF